MEMAQTGHRKRLNPIASLTAIVGVVSSCTLAVEGYRSLGAASRVGLKKGSGIALPRGVDADGRAAFLAAYKVFMHPRCMNCHPAGDAPLQGDDSRAHSQNVKRGPEGKGLYALKCANCHQLANLPGENMPPGNPNWHLPPREMPLVFQGKSPGELARQLKDPKRNGNKTLQQLLHHIAKDKLVLAGWEPGDGRAKPSLSHAEFVEKMREWVAKGAVPPEE
jgi:hypothetical protein